VITAKLTSSDNQLYFLKEIQPNNFHDGIESIYSQYAGVHAKTFQLVTPIEHRLQIVERLGVFRYIFFLENRPFLLLPYLTITPFDPARISPYRLIESICELHNLTRNFLLRTHSRTYEDWLNSGIIIFEQDYGALPLECNLPFLGHFSDFMHKRFPLLELIDGVAHCDVHADNFMISSHGVALRILDFDLSQKTSLAMDYIRGSGVSI
jgi:serine/threonine protein kinase